jgi:hypothetical protein
MAHNGFEAVGGSTMLLLQLYIENDIPGVVLHEPLENYYTCIAIAVPLP